MRNKIIVGKFLAEIWGVKEGTLYPLKDGPIMYKLKHSSVAARAAILDRVYYLVLTRGDTAWTRFIVSLYDDEFIRIMIAKHSTLYMHPVLSVLGYVLEENPELPLSHYCPVMRELGDIMLSLTMLSLSVNLAKGNINYTELFYRNEANLNIFSVDSKYLHVREFLTIIKGKLGIK
mgnify:FL=1